MNYKLNKNQRRRLWRKALCKESYIARARYGKRASKTKILRNTKSTYRKMCGKNY